MKIQLQPECLSKSNVKPFGTMVFPTTVYRLCLTSIALLCSHHWIAPSDAFSPRTLLAPPRQKNAVISASSGKVPWTWTPQASQPSHASLRFGTRVLPDPRSRQTSLIALQQTPDDSDPNDPATEQATTTPTKKDEFFDGRTTAALVGGQSLLIVAAVLAALITKTPNFGLGPGFSLTVDTLVTGTLLALPLGVFAALLDVIEDRVPALKDVSIATQRSILSLLGYTFKPVYGLVVATVLGLAAGIGEELLFRGVMQYELASRLGPIAGVGIASVIFAALHAVTPLYAGLAGVASIYFGALYMAFDNLAVPIATHAIYDVAALFFAHWTVSQLSAEERDSVANWEGPEK